MWAFACSTAPPTAKGTVLVDQATNAWQDPDLAPLPAVLPDTEPHIAGIAVCAGDADLRITSHIATVPTPRGEARVLPRVVVSVERHVADWVITAALGQQVVAVQEPDAPVLHAVPLSVTCTRNGGAETRSTLTTIRADGTLVE
jgi:hypothetical protein